MYDLGKIDLHDIHETLEKLQYRNKYFYIGLNLTMLLYIVYIIMLYINCKTITFLINAFKIY